MANVIEAYKKSIDFIEEALIESGLIKGSLLNKMQIENEKNPIFWKNEATVKEASEKETYAVFEINKIESQKYADGWTIHYNCEIILNVFTRKTDITKLLANIEDKVVEKEGFFNYKTSSYNSDLKFNFYTFLIKVIV